MMSCCIGDPYNVGSGGIDFFGNMKDIVGSSALNPSNLASIQS